MPTTPLPDDDRWRKAHLGRLLGEALRRFDARVLELMAHDPEVPLALSNLAARQQVSAAHIHITRHLALQGSRLTELAEAAGMRDAGTPFLSVLAHRRSSSAPTGSVGPSRAFVQGRTSTER